jgi:hypothetical protein
MGCPEYEAGVLNSTCAGVKIVRFQFSKTGFVVNLERVSLNYSNKFLVYLKNRSI